MDAAIRTQGLTKRYGDFTAVDGVNLVVRRGEIFGLLGPNGAGKTTTILMLLGLSQPSGGRAEVLELDPSRQALDVRRLVGYLPDDVGFYGGLTGRQNLRFTARLNRLDPGEAEERIEALLARVGLADAADKRVEAYSRGMRQRLGIADALLKDPSVAILDEPTAGIDPAGVAEILDLIRSLARERGMTVLLSSHLLHQVESVCDRVAIFVGGRIVAEGTTAALAERFAPEQVTLEVGAAGDPAAVEQALRSVDGVEGVERDGLDGLWLVAASHDVRGPIARALLDAGLVLTHLRRRDEELDELYRRAFREVEHVGAR